MDKKLSLMKWSKMSKYIFTQEQFIWQLYKLSLTQQF